ncbi:MAG TPA: TIGR03560 family F420-dependent LLM class oxidoreductase [Actinomycetota bacterium]|nr:TIGR03560 family F420-dependent LLM class oxidoreductase [Actinomycetota bacterium]
MRIDIETSQHHVEWPDLVERVRLAEDAGFEGVWLFDHFKPLYGDPKGPCLEAWTLLAALAAVTKRVRLGALVTGVTYRHPSILAAEAITVDHVSNGRLDFGIGAAWFEGEHNELGIDFPDTKERVEKLRDAVAIYKTLTTEEDASYEGHHYSLRNATYLPHPVQRPHPPIWIGASGEKVMLPFAGRVADAWHTFGRREDLKRKSDIVTRAAEAAGRDPSTIMRSTNISISKPFDEVRERAAAYRDIGFSTLIVSWPSEGVERVHAFVEEVLPELQAL